MMEEFSGDLHLEADDGYSSALALGRVSVNRSRIHLSRQRVVSTRRGPRRTVQSVRTLFQQFSASWGFEIGDDSAGLKVLLEALADKGSGTAIPGGWQWSFGQRSGHRTFAGYATTADGRSYKLHRGIAAELALTVEPNRIVGAEAMFNFSAIEETAAGPADTTAAPSTYASGVSSLLEWDSVELPTFAVALNFSRSLAPAGMDESGVFAGALGSPVCDITGRLSCRVPVEDDDLFLTQTERSLRLSMTAGGTALVFDFPAVVFESLQRGIASAGVVEHAVQFLARQQTNSALAIVTLLE